MNTTTTTPPIICRGNGEQLRCDHYDTATGCHHPDNTQKSLATGQMLPIYTADYVRGDPTKCGNAAAWYKPRPLPAPIPPHSDGKPF